VTSIWQNPKQPANGREQTPIVFRANGQKTQRLATSRENPQRDEERAWGIPASQPFAFSRAIFFRGHRVPLLFAIDTSVLKDPVRQVT
jgi:hypothetical protein